VLGDCLTSVKPFVDEIIIVDTRIDRQTVEIARDMGPKVFFFPWCNDFLRRQKHLLSTHRRLALLDGRRRHPAPECGQQLHDLVFWRRRKRQAT